MARKRSKKGKKSKSRSKSKKRSRSKKGKKNLKVTQEVGGQEGPLLPGNMDMDTA